MSAVETMNLHIMFTATDIASFCVIAHLQGDSRVCFSYKQEVLVLKGTFHYEQEIHDIIVSVVWFYCNENINH